MNETVIINEDNKRIFHIYFIFDKCSQLIVYYIERYIV